MSRIGETAPLVEAAGEAGATCGDAAIRRHCDPANDLGACGAMVDRVTGDRDRTGRTP